MVSFATQKRWFSQCRSRGHWSVRLLLVLTGLCLVPPVDAVQAAGCKHADTVHQSQGVQADASTTANEFLAIEKKAAIDSALVGNWRYEGGQVFYVFHPLPQPCHGPGCKQAPEHGGSMDALLPPSPRTLNFVPFEGESLGALNAWWPLVSGSDSSASSRRIDEHFRPPRCFSL